MAWVYEEQELLSAEGLDADALNKGGFFQNLFWRQNAWWTRPGFGQLAQYDTLLAFPADGTELYGYETALGSFAFVTDFGHTQIVTLLRGLVFTGSEESLGEWREVFFLSIYDLSTDNRWEVPLHRHTSESVGVVFEMPDWRGAYESAIDFHIASWRATQLQKTVWFNVFEGLLFFGAEGLGVNVYRPSTFFDQRRWQLDSVRQNDWARGYSESALVSPLPPADGVFAEGYDYFSVDAFPSPSDMAAYGDRVVYVSGREVFYTDKLRPQSIMGRNVDFVPSRKELVAVEVLHGVVYLFSQSEIWSISPRQDGAIAAGGRLTQLETDIGALNPRCVLRAGGALFCMDEQGVYVTRGNLVFEKISEAIDPLFESVVSNPLTNYYQNAGWSDLVKGQPQISYSIKESDNAHLAYDPVDELLFIVLPQQNIAFVNQKGAWVLWNFESIANDDAGPNRGVEAKRNIVSPWIVTADRGVFLCGGTEVYNTGDVTTIGGDGAVLGLNARARSYYILMLNRGGGLDRSVGPAEDRRLMNGRYIRLGNEEVDKGIFYIHEPVKAPDQYKLPNNPTKQDDLYLFPVHVVNHHGTGIWLASLRVGYDNNEWEPVYQTGASVQIDLVFPPHREESSAGWGTLAQDAVHQARTWNGAAYARGGREMHFDFSGASGLVDYPAGWTSAPVMNTPPWAECPLFWIPMKKKNPTSDVMGMGWEHVQANLADEGEVAEDVNVFAWQLSDAGGRYINDEVAQPVDWVFMSRKVEFRGRQHKARGLQVFATSHGSASDPLFSNWLHGVLNYVLATDHRGWVSQIVDHTGDIEGVRRRSDKPSIRSRLKDSAGAMKQKVFSSDAKWGDTIDSTKGNVLIGDEEWNELQVSDRGRGYTSTWMLFGHIRSRAEAFAMNRVTGLYRVLGNRRRRGR